MDYADRWLSDLGALQWDNVEAGFSAQGRFNTFVVDDGVDVGRVEIFFLASPCPTLATTG